MKTYKFRLYPSQRDEAQLIKHLEICRWVYNNFLEKLNKSEKIPSKYNMVNRLPQLKEEHPFLKNVYSKVLQEVIAQLYNNLSALSQSKNRGRKVGRLRFKGKGWFKTFSYNQSGFNIIKTGNRLDVLKLSKIGDIPIRIHRQIEGNIKQIIIKRTASEKWYACIQTDASVEMKKGHGTVAIDLNTTNFLTDSDGLVIENPKYLDEMEQKLRVHKKDLSRKKKGSNNRKKARIRLARVFDKLDNKRLDFLHKVSTYYIQNYDTIILEDLKISDMCNGSYYAKSNLDASWGLFKQLLLYKAESAGVEVVFVEPRDTTSECANCHHKKRKKIYEREHICDECGFTTTRDYNAALNILQKGLKKKIGKGQAELTPVDTNTATLTSVKASVVVDAGSSFLSR